MMVPKPFATTMSKSSLVEEGLLKQVRRQIAGGNAPMTVGRWVRQMLDEQERVSRISAGGDILISNGAKLKRQDVVSLTKQR